MEHIFGDWTKEVLPESERTRARFRAVIDEAGTVDQREWDEPDFRHQTRLRALCETCNVVWGSSIESSAQEVLTPIMRGKSRWVRHRDAVAVGRWAMKVAMLREMFDPWQLVSREQRHQFRQTGTPPDTHVVFATSGDKLSSPWRGRDRHVFLKVRIDQTEDAADEPNVHIVTVGMGGIVLIVAGNTLGVPMRDLERAWPSAFVRLWPEPHSFAWPLESALTDALINDVSGDNPALIFGNAITREDVELPPRPGRFN